MPADALDRHAAVNAGTAAPAAGGVGPGRQTNGPATPTRIKLYRGWWYAIYSDGTRASLRTQDKAVAASRFKDLSDAAAAPFDTVDQVLDAYIADLGTRPSAQRARDAKKALAPVFGPLRPDQVDRAPCRVYTARRVKAGKAANTIRRELGIVRAALNWYRPHAGDAVECPPPAKPRERYLTRPEFQRLLAAAEAFHVKLFIVLAVATAGRKEAILTLTWDRVDFARGLINLGRGPRQKGRAVVPMNDSAKFWLQKAESAATTDYVVEWGGAAVVNVRKGFDAAALRAGLNAAGPNQADVEQVTPHTLRHTAAVWMAEAGEDMSKIAQYLGHTDTRTTERIYARYSPTYLRGAAAALEVG